ncbi:MAG: BBP7 family outer membrane beta-barrel protein [Planctomycetia bacterium]|nr:BBP7 family outer membrane beta-barrel protein [Planctomycetia bacterium]
MKVARFLLAPALLMALAGDTFGQAPQGPVSMDPGPMIQGPMSQVPTGDAGPMGPDCYPMPMECGPIFDDCNPQSRLRHRTGRGYVQVDAMLLHRNDATAQTLAFDNTTFGTVVSTKDPNFGFETVPRVTAGYVFNNDIALETTIFYKDDFDAKYTGVAATPGGLSSNFGPVFTFLGIPFSNYIGSDAVSVSMATGIHSYELNLVETSRVFNFIAGFRYMEVRDNMSVVAVNTVGSFPGTSSSYIGTYNSLLGTQFGVKTGYSWELLTIDTSAKAGMYYNNAASTTMIRDVNNTITPVPGDQHRTGTNEAFIGDFNVNLTLRLAPSVAARLGYQAMFITDIALAADQISSSNPNAPLAPTYTGQSQNAHGDLFLHGPSAGLDFRW